MVDQEVAIMKTYTSDQEEMDNDDSSGGEDDHTIAKKDN